MTEYESVYMELRGCTFNVELPQESVTAIIQSMIDKTTLICATRAPKKCCGNCKYFTDFMDDDWVCHNPNYGYGKRVTGDMECDMWECDCE